MMYKQLDLWSYLGFYCDGDLVSFSCLGPVVTFDWLSDHIGCQVAIRFVTESQKYYLAATVVELTKGTYFEDCRRIILWTGKKSVVYLDEPLFFLLRPNSSFYLVYEL